jgi:hypothetical protein
MYLRNHHDRKGFIGACLACLECNNIYTATRFLGNTQANACAKCIDNHIKKIYTFPENDANPVPGNIISYNIKCIKCSIVTTINYGYLLNVCKTCIVMPVYVSGYVINEQKEVLTPPKMPSIDELKRHVPKLMTPISRVYNYRAIIQCDVCGYQFDKSIEYIKKYTFECSHDHKDNKRKGNAHNDPIIISDIINNNNNNNNNSEENKLLVVNTNSVVADNNNNKKQKISSSPILSVPLKIYNNRVILSVISRIYNDPEKKNIPLTQKHMEFKNYILQNLTVEEKTKWDIFSGDKSLDEISKYLSGVIFNSEYRTFGNESVCAFRESSSV